MTQFFMSPCVHIHCHILLVGPLHLDSWSLPCDLHWANGMLINKIQAETSGEAYEVELLRRKMNEPSQAQQSLAWISWIPMNGK